MVSGSSSGLRSRQSSARCRRVESIPGNGEDTGGHFPERWPESLRQFARYCLVGILNGIVDAGVYFILTRWLGFGSLRILAKALSYAAGVVNSFFVNRAWTFRSGNRTLSTVIPFALSNLASLALNAGVMHLALDILQLPDTLAVFVAMNASFFWNFAMSKYVIFRT
jgi:putative flippase GtrA